MTRDPRINFSLPVVGQIVYPKREPFPYAVPKTACAVFFKTGDKPVGDPTDADSEWTIGGEVIRAPRNSTYGEAPYVVCPLLFGREMKDGVVKTRALDEEHSFRVMLAASGKSEPKMESLTARLGDWKLTLTPRPWVSPYFPFRYEVRCDDGRGSTFVVSETGLDLGYYWQQPMLFASRHRPGLLTFSDDGQLKMLLKVRRLIGRDVNLHVVRGELGSETWIQLVDPTGRVLVWRDENRRSADDTAVGFLPNTFVQIDQNWPSAVASWSLSGTTSESETLPFFDDFQDGQTLKAKVFQMEEERSASVILHMPSRKAFQ